MFLGDCRAFIFDMDGVLVDSENLYKVLEQELFDEVGVTIEKEEHISYQGCSNPVMWSKIKEKHGVQLPLDELVGRLETKVLDYFNAQLVIPPMPGVVELLQHLQKKGIKLALASSSTLGVINMILAKTGLAPFFEAIADSIEAGASKPDPAIFLLARQKLGIPAENCVIVEDSANGILAALAANIYCIAYNGPGSEQQDQSAANWRIDKFSEIVELFDKE